MVFVNLRVSFAASEHGEHFHLLLIEAFHSKQSDLLDIMPRRESKDVMTTERPLLRETQERLRAEAKEQEAKAVQERRRPRHVDPRVGHQ